MDTRQNVQNVIGFQVEKRHGDASVVIHGTHLIQEENVLNVKNNGQQHNAGIVVSGHLMKTGI